MDTYELVIETLAQDEYGNVQRYTDRYTIEARSVTEAARIASSYQRYYNNVNICGINL